jgi:hypothetical protein
MEVGGGGGEQVEIRKWFLTTSAPTHYCQDSKIIGTHYSKHKIPVLKEIVAQDFRDFTLY